MKTDKQLQRDALDELAWEPSIDAASIGVSVDSGVVTLSGHVKSYSEKWAAEKAAKRVAGVHGLANELEVRLPSSLKRDDSDIAIAAVSALKWHVDAPDDRIKVVVQEGWVTLEGTVEWPYQRKVAERSVRHLTGVRGVSNMLTIRPHVRPQDVKAKIDAALKRSAEVEAQQIKIEEQDGKVTLRGTVRSWSERSAAERAAWAAPGVMAVENRLTVGALTYA